MKRSEMVKLIQEVVDKGVAPVTSFPRPAADRLLRILERAGMRPPQYTTEPRSVQIRCEDGTYTEHSIPVVLSEWEPE